MYLLYAPLFALALSTIHLTRLHLSVMFLLIDDRSYIVIPVAILPIIVHLQYACYLMLVVMFMLQHVEAVGSEQSWIDSHDVLIIGQSEYFVFEDGTQRQVLFGPTLHL